MNSINGLDFPILVFWFCLASLTSPISYFAMLKNNVYLILSLNFHKSLTYLQDINLKSYFQFIFILNVSVQKIAFVFYVVSITFAVHLWLINYNQF